MNVSLNNVESRLQNNLLEIPTEVKNLYKAINDIKNKNLNLNIPESLDYPLVEKTKKLYALAEKLIDNVNNDKSLRLILAALATCLAVGMGTVFVFSTIIIMPALFFFVLINVFAVTSTLAIITGIIGFEYYKDLNKNRELSKEKLFIEMGIDDAKSSIKGFFKQDLSELKEKILEKLELSKLELELIDINSVKESKKLSEEISLMEMALEFLE